MEGFLYMCMSCYVTTFVVHFKAHPVPLLLAYVQVLSNIVCMSEFSGGILFFECSCSWALSDAFNTSNNLC